MWQKPLGLLRIGSHLRRQGYQIDLLDCLDRHQPGIPRFKLDHTRSNGTGHYYREIIPKPHHLKHIPRYFGRYGLPYQRVKEHLRQMAKPGLVCITSGMTYWYPGIIQMVELIRGIHGNVPIVLGGIYATLCHDHALKHCGVDFVVSGSGLSKTLEIAESVCGPSEPIDTEHPWPAFDLYHHLDYVVLMTSEGCPYRCPFCASHLLQNEFRQFSKTDVYDQLFYWLQSKEVRQFAFYDDALLLNHETHLIPLLKKIIAGNHGFQFHTPNGIHPKYIDKELAALLYQSKFRTLRLSYESRDVRRQKEMGGKVSDAALMKAAGLLRQAGFDAQMMSSYVLMGLPGQAIEEIVDSIEFVLGLQLPVSLASYSPIPGTQHWAKAVERGDIDNDMDPILTNNSIYPLCKNREIYQILSQIRQITNEANLRLKRKVNPLTDKSVGDSLKKLKSEYGKLTVD